MPVDWALLVLAVLSAHGVCASVCVCAHTCVQECVLTYVYTQGPEADVRYLFQYLLHLIVWGKVSHGTWSLPIWLTGWLRDPPASSPQHCDSTKCHCAWLLMGGWLALYWLGCLSQLLRWLLLWQLALLGGHYWITQKTQNEAGSLLMGLVPSQLTYFMRMIPHGPDSVNWGSLDASLDFLRKRGRGKGKLTPTMQQP